MTTAVPVPFEEIFVHLVNSEPYAKENPGWLLKFIEYAENQEETAEIPDLYNIVEAIQEIAQVWLENIHKVVNSKLSKLIKYFREAQEHIFLMSYHVEIREKLYTFAENFKDSPDYPSRETCSSLVTTMNTSILSTTARSQQVRVDAPLSRKRKIYLDSDEEEDLSDEDLFQMNSKYPTCKTSSLISTKRGDESTILELEDEWKQYRFNIRIWKSEDLKNVEPKDHWKHAKKWMTLNFDEKNSKIMTALGAIEGELKQYMKKNKRNIRKRTKRS
uniref:NS2 n=1 Tax=uncultured densovirus TaxID=748192 RepID=A0A7M4BC37_9VIRU|nr:NS2 [uncultured densovirus]